VGRGGRAWIVVVGAAAAAGATTIACSALTSFSDLAGGGAISDASGDASSEATAPSDGMSAADAGTPIAADAGMGPFVLAQAGTVAQATGRAQQTHLLWASATKQWILLYVSSASPNVLSMRHSPDLAQWSDGPTFALEYPHAGRASDFDATTVAMGNVDVIHVTVSLETDKGDRAHYHGRATAAATGATIEPLTKISGVTSLQSWSDPDSPATIVAQDGYVYDFTGWTWTDPADGGSGGSNNSYVFRSSAAETGASFNGVTWGQSNIEIVPNGCNARAAVDVGGGDLLALWEAGDVEPDPTNVHSSKLHGTAWSKPVSVFPSGPMDPNDWAMLSAGNGTTTLVHAVKSALDGTLSHARYDGMSWSTGAVIATEPLTPGAGIVLVRESTGVRLLGIGKGGGAIRATSFDGTSWSPWATLVPTNGPRSALAAATSADGSIAAIVWSEADASGNTQIMGMRLH
jgi:hypothetical protein